MSPARRSRPSAPACSTGRILAGTALVAAALAACTGGSSSPAAPGSAVGSATGGSAGGSVGGGAVTPSSSAPPSYAQGTLSSAKQIYVSIGDSYAAGYQARAQGSGAPGNDGYADQTVTKARAKGYDFTLVNFGCSGATTDSILTSPGCRSTSPGAPDYTGKTQAAAAEAYLRAHRGQVGLITVSIGGNDLAGCKDSADTAAATACLTGALPKAEKNMTTLVAGLRAAAGPDVRMIGLTYPDIFLGESLRGKDGQGIAELSVLGFRSFINPQFERTYASAGARFLDVTDATGAYLPLTQKTTLAPYGSIPVAVARICTLTYYCQFRDIHPRSNGYALIAGLIVDTLPER